MRKLVLAALLAMAASPAWAETGRLACQMELADVIAGTDRQTAARVDLAGWTEVISAQCASSWGLAQASMETLRGRLEAAGRTAEVANAQGTIEWPTVAGLAD